MDSKTDKKKSVLSKVSDNFLNKLENLMGGKKVVKTKSPKKCKPKKIKLPKKEISIPPPLPLPLPLEIKNIQKPIPIKSDITNNKLNTITETIVKEKIDNNIILEIIKEQNKYNTDIINKIMYISDNRDLDYLKNIKIKLYYLLYFFGGIMTTYIIQKFI